ncbi:uncharacterized protein LOC123267978 [Cotesia glomerata]|uniref:uncharacterized protein LOC123267978 n=1 Tax=Cotesia glomerata TaxID=32391 RepID=UPI001D01253C|nr:uncharacterized protein LOC123267978 [Cotesia glomerata]
MSKPFTKGSLCEVKAAAELFPYEFQVYQDGRLIATFGEALNGIKRLSFNGDYNDGHYEVLVPLFQPINIDDAQIPNNINDNHESTNENIPNSPLAQLASNTFLLSCDESISENKTVIQSKRGTKRRKKFSGTIRTKQLREAASKYAENHREVNRESVKRYAKSHPKVKPKLLPWNSKHLSGFKYNSKINYSNDKIVNFGPHFPCPWCRVLKWKDETQGMCCSSGKVQLSEISPNPEPLHSLLTHQDPLSDHFLMNARKYNGCFQMTSFGAKEVREGNFLPTFKVQGQVYHRIGSLIPDPNQKPFFLQIYFVSDENHEKTIRCGIYPGVYPELVHQLQVLLHEHNKYIRDFKAAVDSIPKNQKDFKIIINADRKPAKEHKGRYNAPQAKEVAVLIVGQHFEKRDIVLQSRNNTLMRISETQRSYDALQYPLMFCYGEDGYHINISKRDVTNKLPLNKTVSASEFYSFRIMEREGELTCMQKLKQRLYWIRNNQKTLRSEEYVHLKDALSNNDNELSTVGKMVMLPSSLTGGPRYMHERTQDAMTYVRHYGRPDLFITFTCNPKWPEITELLSKAQHSHDRHDIIARVFKVKVKHMMKLLTVGRIFGDTRCYMYTIEWQKRGLPHVHILLWLEEKIRPESIDQIICAELSDPNKDPDLYQVIKTTMVHGPCGSFNSKSPCMVDGKCAKKYPKVFLKETETGEDGYPKYRRRSPADGERTFKLNGVEINNRWIVPYNPVLSHTFGTHINIEICNSVKSIKYICKYVNKGSDQAEFTVEDFDEVKKYQAGRYISSCELVWRIFRFPIHDRFPPVMHFIVHLENGQRIYFTEKDVVDKFQLITYRKITTERRKKGKDVPGYLGIKKDHVLGRVYTVHPGNTECYHLRLLLHEIRGPTSFSALKTVDGVIHPTFQAACRTLGLLEDDANWDHTLKEAYISDSPYKIRELFAIILFGLNSPSRNEGYIITNRQYLSELAYDTTYLATVVAENVPKLNVEQKQVYSEILNSIASDSGQLYFLDAPGGTGKTLLINLLLAKIRREKNIAVAVDSSGFAAILIDRGKTAHSAFKLPLNLCCSEYPLCNISKQSDMAHVLREAKIIIWDECTMAHKKGIEALNRTLKDIRSCDRTMGGVIVLLAGDFRQTLPVVPRGTRADEVKACIKSSILWPSVKVLSLTINMRAHLQSNLKAEEFSKILIDIGNGSITEENGRIKLSCIDCEIVPDLITLTNKVYPNIDKAGNNCSSWLKERTILTPTNEQANYINNFLLEKISTEQTEYESVDTVTEDDDAVQYPVEFLHTLNPPGIPPHILHIKSGAPIMLLRNLNPPKLCNGTRLQVQILHKNVIEAMIITGKNEGETVFIPRIPLIPSDYHFAFKRLQFPMKACYTMTINKAQGQSLKIAGIDLRNDCFSHGQLYVAFSRKDKKQEI